MHVWHVVVHGKGWACMLKRACVVKGGVHVERLGMHNEVACGERGACLVKNTSGQYASYWNAFLLEKEDTNLSRI